MRIFFVTFLLLWPSVTMADRIFASYKVEVKTYLVVGESIPQVKANMKTRGPNGYWGYTRYDYTWDGRCNMRFKATVTMPKLENRDALSAKDLARWDKMLVALEEHEMGHVAIGREWATAIKRAKCRRADVKKINAEFEGKDVEFDARTQHGFTTGARF